MEDGLAPASGGLQPSSDDLQPTSNGLQPSSDGLQPASDGLQPTSDGLQPASDGLQPTSDGRQPTSDGLQASSNGNGLNKIAHNDSLARSTEASNWLNQVEPPMKMHLDASLSHKHGESFSQGFLGLTAWPGTSW